MPRPKTRELSKPSPDDVAAQINAFYKKEVMKKGSDPYFRIERIPSGILSVDCVMGGGFARNRHCEIYGGFSVGKTYTVYRLIGNAQKLGYGCAFVDAEHGFDPEFAESAGVDVDKLWLPPEVEHGHHAVDVMEMLIRSGEYDIVALDSIASLVPKGEVTKSSTEGNMGTQQAKLMSEALRRLTNANRRTCIVYINQTREAIGVMFGKRSVTSGGRAMGFYAGTRLEMTRTENIKKSVSRYNAKGVSEKMDVVTAHRVLVRVEKDKTGGAKQSDTTSFVFDYGLGGIDPIEDLIYLGLQTGLVHAKGSPGVGQKWWVEGYEEDVVSGRNRFRSWLKKNPGVCSDLEEEIRQNYGTDSVPDEDESE